MIDRNVSPNRSLPQWSETRWNGCWNPDEGVGLYLHMGRQRGELDLWWAQTVAYLPGGRLVVDRSWGRSRDDASVRTGCFELRLTEAGWESRFDGAGELTDTATLARAPRGASAPAASLSWEVRAEAAAPVWDLYAGIDERHEFAGDGHIQQAFRTSGRLTVAGREYSLDGVGFKDHSSGVRKWDTYGGHHFVLAQMPGWTMHTVVMHDPAGVAGAPMGAVFEDGQQLPMAVSELALLSDPTGGPDVHELVVEHRGGQRLALRAEVLHALPITVTDGGDNINGIDWSLPGDPVVVLEAFARLTEPDGSVGYAFFERGARRSALREPSR